MTLKEALTTPIITSADPDDDDNKDIEDGDGKGGSGSPGHLSR